jgi:hypothetical protein
MKKALITLLISVALASAYCERGSQIEQGYEGGHKFGLYDFGQGRFLKFNFPSGASVPYSIRYDFWKGEVCY